MSGLEWNEDERTDVANLAAFVLSPKSRYLHGSLIDLDGGQTKTI